MFMSPTTPISVPLYGIECYTSCSTAQQHGACDVSTIAGACPIACHTGVVDGEDKLTAAGPGVNEFKMCFSDTQLNVQFALLIAATVPIAGLLRLPSVVRWLDRITGGVFVAFGLRLVLERR
jgi:hypothetical protein